MIVLSKKFYGIFLQLSNSITSEIDYSNPFDFNQHDKKSNFIKMGSPK